MQQQGAVKVFGIPLSSYVWSTRITLAEKGVGYELVANPPNSPAQLEVHPFGKVPAFRHGDVALFEASAIGRYVDEAFDGPALQPADAAGRGRMEQWISAASSYLYPTLIMGIVLPRLNPHFQGEVDEGAIAAAVDRGHKQLAVFDRALSAGDFLVGGGPTLADFILTPIALYASMTPEGDKLFAGLERLNAWRGRMAGRASVQSTMPSAG